MWERGDLITLHPRSWSFQATLKLSQKHEQWKLSLQLLTFSMNTAMLLRLCLYPLQVVLADPAELFAPLPAPALGLLLEPEFCSRSGGQLVEEQSPCRASKSRPWG